MSGAVQAVEKSAKLLATVPCEMRFGFRTEIASTGKTLDGIDLVSVDADGLITDFAVLARPPNAVAALKDEMMRRVPVKIDMYEC